MDTDLTTIKAALADISDTELATLIAATYGVPQTAPGPLAWIDSAAEWELNRRRDFDYPLLPPEAAIDPSEDAASIGGALLLRASLATDGQAVTVLFDAIVALLTGKERRHWHWRRRSDGTGMAGLERAGVGVMRHGGVGQDAARSDALRDHAHHRHAQSRRDRASNQAWRATPLELKRRRPRSTDRSPLRDSSGEPRRSGHHIDVRSCSRLPELRW
jgi:hypothetical protein